MWRGNTVISKVRLIIALFVTLSFSLILLLQVQENALVAVRAYIGAEGLWAKAQKDATHSLELYAEFHNEDDYETYRKFIQIPLGDLQARIELQKTIPNLDAARDGFINGGNHPDDIRYMIDLFRRFSNATFMAEAIRHWTLADQFIRELDDEATKLHEKIILASDSREDDISLLTRLDYINQRVTEQENLFSSTLANASRLAANVSRYVAYGFTILFILIGIGVSWPIIASIRGIEQRLRLNQKALTDVLAEKEAILQNALVGIALMRNRQIVTCNKRFEELFGYPLGAMAGKSTRVLYPTDDVFRNIGEEAYRVLARGENFNTTISLQRLDGSVFWGELSGRSVNPDHALDGYSIWIYNDVSARRMAEQELVEKNAALERSNADLEQFAYVASHDLQTPLRNIVRYTQLLERRYRGKIEPDADDFIGFVVDSGKHMTHLINDLLEFSRVSRQSVPLEPKSAGEAVAQALKNLDLELLTTGAVLNVGDLPTVVADQTYLVSLFQNLLGNGIKYRAPDRKPVLSVSAERISFDYWRFAVTDNGIGIEPQYHDKIFEIFQRLDPVSHADGTGIGLTLCRRIVHRFGGTIWVMSAPGKGSTFFFTLRDGSAQS